MSQVLRTESARFNSFLIALSGGVAVLLVALLVQSLSFGIELVSVTSLAIPFALGFAATLFVERMLHGNLRRLRNDLQREFDRRTQELRTTEDRFRQYTETSSEWFWETDADHRFAFLSSHVFEISGARPEDVLGRTREELRLPTQSPEEEAQWQNYRHCVTNRLPLENFEYRARIADGHELLIRTNGKPFYDSDGNFLGYRGAAYDASDDEGDEYRNTHAYELIYTAASLLNDGFVLFDADDRLVMCNGRYRRIYAAIADRFEPGVSYTEIATAYAETLEFADEEHKASWIEQRIAQHRNPSGSYDRQLANGDWVRVIDQKLPGGGLVGLRIDISDSKRIEDELEQAQRIARLGSFRWDIDRGKIISCTAEYANLYGVSLEEALQFDQEKLDAFVHPDDLERINTIYEKGDTTGEGYEVEYRIQRRDGEIRNVIERAVPAAMAGGRVIEFICTQQDITELKRIERELETAQAIAGVGSFRWDLEHSRMASYSKEYLRIHGRSAEEMDALGLDGLIEQIIHPDDRQRVRETFAHSDAKGERYQIEYRIRRPNGEYRQVVERCETSVWRDGRPVEQLGTLQDVTGLRQFEQELEDAQRLARIGSFRWDAEQQRLISGSPTYLEILGRTPDELKPFALERFQAFA